MDDWYRLELLECKELEFVEYFCKFKLEDLRDKMVKYVVYELGLGEELYLQNILEVVNVMLKEWNNFVFQELDCFVVFLYDFVEVNKMEIELVWFGLLDKWKVFDDFKQYILS